MSGKNRKGKNYPWYEWLKPGTSRTLIQNKDYFCSDRSMTTYLYMRATAGKVYVSVEVIKPGRIKITVCG